MDYPLLRTELEKLGQELEKKNESYGRSIEKAKEILDILYPNGIKTEQYGDLHFVVRVLDKLTRITGGDKRSFGESPWWDLAGYAALRHVQEQEEKMECAPQPLKCQQYVPFEHRRV